MHMEYIISYERDILKLVGEHTYISLGGLRRVFSPCNFFSLFKVHPLPRILTVLLLVHIYEWVTCSSWIPNINPFSSEHSGDGDDDDNIERDHKYEKGIRKQEKRKLYITRKLDEQGSTKTRRRRRIKTRQNESRGGKVDLRISRNKESFTSICKSWNLWNLSGEISMHIIDFVWWWYIPSSNRKRKEWRQTKKNWDTFIKSHDPIIPVYCTKYNFFWQQL